MLRIWGATLYALLQAASFMHSLLITIKSINLAHPVRSTILQQNEYDQTIKILRAVSAVMVEGFVQVRVLDLRIVSALYCHTGSSASVKVLGRPPPGLIGLMR